MTRRVVLIFGPPGAGKTTFAGTLGLDLYDRDDPIWHNDERRFREALRHVGRDPVAQAAVIRTGATPKARADATAMCNPTEVRVIATPVEICIERIRARGRGDVRSQIAGARKWWDDYRPDETLNVTQGATSRAW